MNPRETPGGLLHHVKAGDTQNDDGLLSAIPLLWKCPHICTRPTCEAVSSKAQSHSFFPFGVSVFSVILPLPGFDAETGVEQ